VVQVMEHLGAAAFSRAVQARDLRTGALVCLKVVKVAGVLSCVCQIWLRWLFPQSTCPCI
jgi:hypothetical protein